MFILLSFTVSALLRLSKQRPFSITCRMLFLTLFVCIEHIYRGRMCLSNLCLQQISRKAWHFLLRWNQLLHSLHGLIETLGPTAVDWDYTQRQLSKCSPPHFTTEHESIVKAFSVTHIATAYLWDKVNTWSYSINVWVSGCSSKPVVCFFFAFRRHVLVPVRQGCLRIWLSNLSGWIRCGPI